MGPPVKGKPERFAPWKRMYSSNPVVACVYKLLSKLHQLQNVVWVGAGARQHPLQKPESL